MKNQSSVISVAAKTTGTLIHAIRVSALAMLMLAVSFTVALAQNGLVHEFATGSTDGIEGVIGEVNGDLYVVADDGTGRNIWKRTSAGTVTKETSIFPSQSGSTINRNFFAYGDYIYFSGRTSSSGSLHLYGLNTTTGTLDVEDATLGDPNHWFVYNNKVYFISSKSGIGRQLWSVDTAGTITRVTTTTHTGGVGPMANSRYQVVKDGKLYTAGYLGSYNCGTFTCIDNQEFIIVDLNTGAITSHDLFTGSPSGASYSNSSNPKHFYEHNNKIYFAATNPQGGSNHRQLFVYDIAGGGAPTKLSAFTHNHSGDDGVADLLEAGGNIYFRTEASGSPRYGELYSYNIANDTISNAVTNFNVGYSGASPFLVEAGTLHFIAFDGVNTDIFKLNPSDNSYAGVGLTDIYWASFYDTIMDGDIIYFTGTSNASGDEILSYNKSTDAYAVEYDLEAGANSSYAANLVRHDGDIFFAGSTAATGFELFRFDLGSAPAPNNPPTLSSITISTDEDTPMNILTAVDTQVIYNDADSDPLAQITFTVLPTNGTLDDNGTPIVVNTVYPANMLSTLGYTPNANFNGTDSFVWNASDGTDFADSTATMTITVNPVNDIPTVADGTITLEEDVVTNIAANAPSNIFNDIDGDPLSFIKVTQLPTNGNLEYQFGAVVLNTDYTADDLLTFTYTPNANYNGRDEFHWNASDADSYAASGAVMHLTITPVNDAPFVFDASMATIEETTINISANLTPQSYSDIEGDTVTKVQIKSLPANGTLEIAGSAVALNDEISAPDFLNLTYTPDTHFAGTDAFNYNSFDGNDYAASDATISITVRDVNDAITDIDLSNTTVDENQTIGTVVGDITVSDNDTRDVHSYSIVGGSNYFTIVNAQLITNQVLDYETSSRHQITIEANDNRGSTIQETYTITINDVNEAPVDVALSSTTVSESVQNGGLIGIISSADEDNSDPHTYSLVAGAGDVDNASFSVTSNVLRSNTTFDVNNQQSYSIRLAATDAGGLSFEKQFTITVVDANQAPTAISLDNTTVFENATVGTSVGQFSSSDADVSDTHTYTLVAGNGDEGNAAFSISGNQLVTAIACDFETQDTYSIRVRSTDSGNASTEEEFTITVLDVNEAPTAITLSNNVIDENRPAGTTVGTLTVTDVDAETHSITLVQGTGSTDNGSFSIAGNVLSTTAVFDAETKDTYSIRVAATDGAGQSTEEIFTINIADVNDKPTDITVTVLDIDENSPSTATIGFVGTVDPDAGNTHTYTFVSGNNDNASFGLNANKLETLAPLNFENKQFYTIAIRSTDQDGLYMEKAFTITVNDVNEVPLDIIEATTNAEENMPTGTTVAILTSDDVDAGDSHTYQLVAGAGDTDNALFTIVGAEVKTAAALNYEVQNTFSVRVQTTDAGGLSKEDVVIITITDGVDAPAALDFSKTLDQNTFVKFAPKDFGNNISDEDGDQLSGIIIATLPSNGILYYRGIRINVGDEYDIRLLGNVAYSPNRNFSGTDSFQWIAKDDNAEGTVSGTVTFIVNATTPPVTPPTRTPTAQPRPGFVSPFTPATPIPTVRPTTQNKTSEQTVSNEEMVIQSLELTNAYPNPFTDATNISYQLPAAYMVQVKVYDMLGKQVGTLVDGLQGAGEHNVTFNGVGENGKTLAPGKYLIRITVATEGGEMISTHTNSVIKF